MPVNKTTPTRVWTVAEAKARLSEVLRLAEEEGPQRIGTRKPFVVVPAAVWEEITRPRKPLGQWLIENVPRGTNLDLPDRSSNRPIPFIDENRRMTGYLLDTNVEVVSPGGLLRDHPHRIRCRTGRPHRVLALDRASGPPSG